MFLAFLWNTERILQTGHRIPCCLTKMLFATQKHFSSAFFSPPPPHYLWHLSDTLFSRYKVKPCILRRNMHHFIAWFRIDYPLISMRLQKGTPHNTCMAHSFYSPIHVNHATIADWTGNRWWPYSIKTQNKNHMKILHIQNFILPLHPQLGENLNVMAG